MHTTKPKPSLFVHLPPVAPGTRAMSCHGSIHLSAGPGNQFTQHLSPKDYGWLLALLLCVSSIFLRMSGVVILPFFILSFDASQDS